MAYDLFHSPLLNIPSPNQFFWVVTYPDSALVTLVHFLAIKFAKK